MAGTIHIEYGAYAHPVGEVVLSIRRAAVVGASQNPWAERVQISLVGQLIGTSISDMNTKIDNLISGYANDNQDFKVIDGASTLLRLSLASSATLGGIRVVQAPSFPSSQDAAYVTFMPYQIVLEAEVAVGSPETLLENFTESIAFTGGGPEYDLQETRVGLPQKQLITQHTIYKAVQSGSAMGLYTFPTVPLPLWPTVQVKAGDISQTGGRMVGSRGRFMHFRIAWRYEFKSPVQLFGTPNNWGV